MSTSKKHRSFVSEPVRNKPVTDIAGVGSTLGQRLSNSGYNKASKVVGQYLVMDGNKREFKQFMGQTCYANDKQANDAYKCVKEYTDNFM